jgi:hypothetical protein
MANTNRSEWAKVNREYARVCATLGRAIGYLTRTESRDANGSATEWDTLRAVQIIEQAGLAIDREHTAKRKALGVGIYSPYGAR